VLPEEPKQRPFFTIATLYSESEWATGRRIPWDYRVYCKEDNLSASTLTYDSAILYRGRQSRYKMSTWRLARTMLAMNPSNFRGQLVGDVLHKDAGNSRREELLSTLASSATHLPKSKLVAAGLLRGDIHWSPLRFIATLNELDHRVLRHIDIDTLKEEFEMRFKAGDERFMHA
jgi:hypothetical protein